MTEKYACYCGSVFTDELELIQHIKDNHVEKIKRVDELEDVLQAIKNNFPDIKVKTLSGEGWYCKTKFDLDWKGIKIEQHYGNSKHFDYEKFPETITQLVEEIQWKINIINQIINEVNNLGKFDYFKCKEFSYGYSSDEHRFEFLYKLKNGYERVNYYHPWDCQSEYKNVNDFINSFKIYFIKEIEGITDIIYDQGYFVGFSVNGINITPLFENNKKIKITVLED